MIDFIAKEGRLCADPKEARTSGGSLTVSGRIACQRPYKSKTTGDYETDFIGYVIYGDRGMYFKKAFRKGNKAVIQGRLEIRSFKDKDGNNREYPEIVVSDWSFPETKKEDQIRTNAEMDDRYNNNPPDTDIGAAFQELSNDGDLPF